MNVPEGVQTVTAEGRDLKMAIAGAAEQLGVHPAQVDYKLDLNHFRNAAGVSMARSTVRIVAWGTDRSIPTSDNRSESEGSARPPRHETRPRPEPKSSDAGDGANGVENGLAADAHDEDDDRRRRRRRKKPRGDRSEEAGGEVEEAAAVEAPSKPESLRGAEQGSTEASDYAQTWFAGLLERMGVEGTAVGSGSADRVHLAVKAERAGRIVGKRGATLGSIRHLLGLAIEQRFGPMTIDVDVGDDRPREDRDVRSSERPERRPDRGGRGRDRDRDRDRDRGRDRHDRDRGRYPEEKIRALARRAAEKALESGQTITINLELNSFDRRIVHLEVSEIDGVESQSEERQGSDGRAVKYVQIIPVRD